MVIINKTEYPMKTYNTEKNIFTYPTGAYW